MNKIKIEHTIDDTSKEIYEFEYRGGEWLYTGIMYSHRNDKNDVWGDDWNTAYEFIRQEDLDRISRELVFDDFGDLLGDYRYSDFLPDEINEIDKKYNPCCQKTAQGKTYYSGIYWGYGSTSKKHLPKLKEEDIIRDIKRQTAKVKIKLYS